MNRRRTRVAAVTVATLGVFLTMTSAAFAHATLSPPVAETGVLQQFTLAVPTDEDAVFRFSATLTGGSETYTFGVRQTYSDGSVVEWTGNETSDTPSPTIKGVSSIGGGASSTLGIIAIVVAAVALLLAVVSLFSRRRSLT